MASATFNYDFGRIRFSDSSLKFPVLLGGFAFPPKGDELAFNSKGTIYLWDTSALRTLSELPDDEVSRVTKNGLPESARPQLVRRMKTQLADYVESLAFSNDGTRLASFADGISLLRDFRSVRGKYQLEDFGDDLLSGHVPFEIEETEQGVTVAAIDDIETDDDVVVGEELQVGDTLVAISDESIDDPIQLGNAMTIESQRLLVGPHQSTVRIRLRRDNSDEREVQVRRSRKVALRANEVCFLARRRAGRGKW